MYNPTTTTDELSVDEKKQLSELLRVLDEDEDVQEVSYVNYRCSEWYSIGFSQLWWRIWLDIKVKN